MLFAFFCLMAFGFSVVFTGLFRRYAIATQLLDIPNERSSHSIPTPRGGGLVFVLCFLFFLVMAYCVGDVESTFFLSLLFAGLLIAVTGFIDDRIHVSAKRRLMVHFFAAALAIYAMGGVPPLVFWAWQVPGGLVLSAFAVFFLVWLINLYNFMDGINGLAAVEAITVCLGGALFSWLHGDNQTLYLSLGLASIMGGFLYWNFPVARIFMGDVGSGFLGLTLGLMALQAGKTNPDLFWSWLILLGVFIVDATLTLISRALSGERIFDAHAHHAYQHAAQRCGRHEPVTLAVFAINVLWLLPMATLVACHQLDGVVGLLLACVPLFFLKCHFDS